MPTMTAIAAVLAAAFAADAAWHMNDEVTRDQKLAGAEETARRIDFANDEAQLRLIAIRMRSPLWPSWPRPKLGDDASVTGVSYLIDAREKWSSGDLDGARQLLRRSRAEGIDTTMFREEAELLSAELGLPATLLPADPPYPNRLRFLAIFDLERLRKTKS